MYHTLYKLILLIFKADDHHTPDNAGQSLNDALNEDPDSRYRETMFAPGAAVNKKHQTAPTNYARNPKIDFPVLDQQYQLSKNRKQTRTGGEKEKEREPQKASDKDKDKTKKEECNMF